MSQHTLFHEKHLHLGAKMIDFGGWDMPIHYGSQVGEHLHTRSDTSLFDVSHMAVLDCFGSNAPDFLRYVLANNIDKLITVGQGLYSCMLNHEGGIIDDLIVYRLPDRFRLVINASTAITDFSWLEQQALTFKDLTLIPRRSDMPLSRDPEVLLAVQGPNAEEAICQIFPAFKEKLQQLPYFHAVTLSTLFGQLMISRTGYTGEDGFELSVSFNRGHELWDCLLSQGIQPAGLGARDTLRIEAGYNLYGQDMNSSVSPFDCGLSWTVDLKSPRDFIGKSALITLGQQFDFLGLVLLGKGVLRSHQKVLTLLGDGEITSGTYSPSIEKSIALARLPKGQIIGSTVHVLIRDQTHDVQIVKPAFFRHGQSLI
jgi:aminomethyltransferase